MWEMLLSVELGKFVLEQVLNLGKSALEDYIKDFFKDCIKGSVAADRAETLKQPMAEAIGQFMKRFVEELQMNEVPQTSINHHYNKQIKRFIQDKAVCPLLGKAFETDCKAIAVSELERIWQERYQEAGWLFPEEFDWRGVAKKYVFEVKAIVKANLELRSLLEIDLQEQQTESLKQLAGINPGFDVSLYRESLQCSYGYLKLYTLDSTDRAESMRLWRMFIEQTVREALPPLRYEIPLDVKRQLQAEGGLEADLSSEALAIYRQEYFQQPAQKVLGAIADSRRAVILGDPGAGKSTVLQYLALAWVEDQREALPLLIELRDYALAGVSGFLEFFHRGKGADWRFDQGQLHQHLLEQPSIVMFDGLDEVFDRATQSAIMDEIVRFGQMYPLAQVLVTSRIIGYNPERLQQAGFQQFTIQPLDTDEIHEFIDRWYDLALGNDADKVRLVTRLKDAIANSKAIQNLADNPLLLTMMAILNRRQELPRDRADLYDQASRVLLYHWDVDHKRLQLPMDAIGRREKQEMLRLIAYEMQTSEEGLKGNLIRADRLVRILTDYLREQGFEAPREKANGLIEQLRHRNWILCDRGADTYGFVHRTFLEYFCAMEIVHRFEKSRVLTFEQLRDEIFGLHWQDETWHEVLRLICGAIDPQFAGDLIVYLINLEIDRTSFLKEIRNREKQLKAEGLANLFLATDCLLEIRDHIAVLPISTYLLSILQEEIEHPKLPLHWRTTRSIMRQIVRIFPNALPWLKQCFSNLNHQNIREAVVYTIPIYWRDDPQTLQWLQECLLDKDEVVRMSALVGMSDFYKEDSDTWKLLMDGLTNDWHSEVRWGAIHALGRNFLDRIETFDLLCVTSRNDPFIREENWERNPREEALRNLLTHYPTHPKTLELLHDRALNDPDYQLRQWAQEQLQKLEASP